MFHLCKGKETEAEERSDLLKVMQLVGVSINSHIPFRLIHNASALVIVLFAPRTLQSLVGNRRPVWAAWTSLGGSLLAHGGSL